MPSVSLPAAPAFASSAAGCARDAAPPEELVRRVERRRRGANSDRTSTDRLGDARVTASPRGAVGASSAEGCGIPARDPRMVWPNGLLRATVSRLSRMPFVNDGQDRRRPRSPAPSAVGC